MELEGRRIEGTCSRKKAETQEGWIRASQAHFLPSSIFLREGKKRSETEEDNGEQKMSQSDIMNSHTLIRPIYCRHQQ